MTSVFLFQSYGCQSDLYHAQLSTWGEYNVPILPPVLQHLSQRPHALCLESFVSDRARYVRSHVMWRLAVEQRHGCPAWQHDSDCPQPLLHKATHGTLPLLHPRQVQVRDPQSQRSLHHTPSTDHQDSLLDLDKY